MSNLDIKLINKGNEGEVYLSGRKVGNFKDKEHIKQVMGDYVVVEEKSPEDNVRIFVCEKA